MHAYALVKTPPGSLSLPEGAIAALQLVGNESLSVVVEPELSLEDLQQDDALLLQAVLAHDRVIRELFAQTTVLPLRFASSVPLESLLQDLQTNQQQYLEAFSRLEGKAEYTLTLTALPQPQPSISPDLTGRAYFLARKQQVQAQQAERQQQLADIQAVLAAIAHRYPYVIAETGEQDRQQIHLLVPQAEEIFVRQAAAIAFNETSPRWQVSLSEALPPYHFVS
jgi:hypothetical protein